MTSERDVGISISRAENNDIPNIIKIALELNLSFWSKADYELELTNKDGIFLVAKEKINEQTIGFMVARLIMPSTNHFAEIYNIGVTLQFQRNSVGKHLISELLILCHKRGISEIWLEVRSLNNSALEFYKSIGFIVSDKRKNFYNNPVDDAFVLSYEVLHIN